MVNLSKIKIRRDLKKTLTSISKDLDQVEVFLDQELNSENPLMGEIARYVRDFKGKRLRPALVLLSARCFTNEMTPEIIKLAGTVELIHTATLIHDDIIDEASVRRKAASINALWGSATSVIFGDYLFSLMFCLAAEFPQKEVSTYLSKATRDMCEGEMLQLESRCNSRLTNEDRYYLMIKYKTASFCSTCCRLGALLGDASEREQEALAEFGHNLGMVFQICDDRLDIMGEEGKMGKSLGTDILTGKLTLPLIHALDSMDEKEKEEFEQKVWPGSDNGQLDEICDIIAKTGSLDYTLEQARQYAEKAKICLASENIRGLSEMSELVDFLVDRDH